MTGQELISLMDRPDTLDEKTLPAITRLVEEYPYFQTARLLYVLNLSVVKDSVFAAELKKMAVYAGDRKQLFYRLVGDRFAHIRFPLAEEDNFSVKDTFGLIDSFLKEIGVPDEALLEYTKPVGDIPSRAYRLEDLQEVATEEPISMKHQDIIDDFLKTDLNDPVRIVLDENIPIESPANQNSEEAGEFPSFFSETLAKIYIKQEKYDKALEIIRKLSLLYPEKSVYFADQIRNLEELIINKKNI